jgi:hypothetical protein
MQSTPDRHAARGGDLGRDLGRRQDAAVARLGALAQLDLDHLHLRSRGVGDEALLVEAAVGRCGSRSSPSRSPRSGRRRARGGSGEIEPSPVSCAKPPSLAPWFSARMALADSAPKLIAEMLKTLARRAARAGRAPMVMRKSDGQRVGCIEWLIHS